MEASTEIGFQTVLAVSELGLSCAHWPVSMVTSLMGVRGCVLKRSPIHSSLYGGKESHMMWCCAKKIPCSSEFPFITLDNRMISFTRLGLIILHKLETFLKKKKRHTCGNIRLFLMGTVSLSANRADLEAPDPKLITSPYIVVSTGVISNHIITEHLTALLGSLCSLRTFTGYQLNELN